MQNPYENAKKQVLMAYEILKDNGVDYDFITEFLYPDRVIKVNIPVKMDNGEIKIFKGYRSQHKNIKGPYKGGIRFHQDVGLDEVKALSLWMSIKTSVVKLPLGGGKGGVIVNPKELSKNELERLSRGYVKQLYRYLGPDFDIPAPDVNTNPQIMAWMVDEYSRLVGKYTPGAFTGKPLELGGSKGRNIATALGGIYTLEQYCKMKGIDIKGKRIVIQGAGNAGLNFAKLIEKKGGKVIAISDSKGGIYDEDGINLAKIEKFKSEKRSVIEVDGIKKITNKEILELETDILVLAALENQITNKNVEKIKASIIVELANGPIIPDVDDILFNKNIIVLPDILANAGGVTVSYFEQIQGNMNFYWDEKEVFERLKAIMDEATKEIIEFGDNQGINYRKSAYVLSLKRQYNAWKYFN